MSHLGDAGPRCAIGAMQLFCIAAKLTRSPQPICYDNRRFKAGERLRRAVRRELNLPVHLNVKQTHFEDARARLFNWTVISLCYLHHSRYGVRGNLPLGS